MSSLSVRKNIFPIRKGYISPVFAFAVFLFVAASFGGFLFLSKNTDGNFGSSARKSPGSGTGKSLLASSNKIKADIFPDSLSQNETPVTAEVKTAEGFTPEEVLVKLTIRNISEWKTRRGELQITTDSYNYSCNQIDRMDTTSNPFTASLRCTRNQDNPGSFLNVYFDNLSVKCSEIPEGSVSKAGNITVSVLADNETASAVIKCQ